MEKTFNTAITNKNYTRFAIDQTNRKVVYLGYDLKATKTEYQLLLALSNNGNSPLSAEQISSLSGVNFTKESLAFHVLSINNKAKTIGNRPLIKNIAKIGYFLNEEM